MSVVGFKLEVAVWVLALCFVWLASSQPVGIDPPRHPKLLPKLDETSYDSLMAHGIANLLYGRWLVIYAAPACKAAVWFTCANTSETSIAGRNKYLRDAAAQFRKANMLKPTDGPSVSNLFDTLKYMNNLSDAVDLIETRYFDARMAFTPRQVADTLNNLHVFASRNCMWDPLSRAHKLIRRLVEATNITLPAMHYVEIPGLSPRETLSNMKGLSRSLHDLYKDQMERMPARRSIRKMHESFRGVITVGYVSAKGFQRYSTTDAMLTLMMMRDRRRFRVICYAAAGDDGSGSRRLTQDNCDAWVEAAGMAPLALARRIRADGVHILVDLHGYTLGSGQDGENWAAVLPFRAAPIQIHFHGQPQTTGSSWIDYYISDPRASPPEYPSHYTERLVLLPGAYLCTSLPNAYSAAWTSPPPARVTRKRYGFNNSDVIAVYFGQPYKIEPSVFDAWMRILSAVPRARLWLFRFPIQAYGGDRAEEQMREEARARGVDPARLVFSDLFDKDEEHVTKGLGDVFLDTWVFNAHTTLTDGLYAGLPVVTLPGRGQVARVGASLALAAANGDVTGGTLIARDSEDYIKLAVAALRRPKHLRRIKRAAQEGFRHVSVKGYQAPLWDNRYLHGGMRRVYAYSTSSTSSPPPRAPPPAPEPRAAGRSSESPACQWPRPGLAGPGGPLSPTAPMAGRPLTGSRARPSGRGRP